MTTKNKEGLQRIIFSRMRDKKYWLFGRTLTSSEAIARLENEPSYYYGYWSCKNNNYAYDYELRQIKQLANASETIQLSEEMSWILRYTEV
jgi:hypothetical protein